MERVDFKARVYNIRIQLNLNGLGEDVHIYSIGKPKKLTDRFIYISEHTHTYTYININPK